MAPYEYEALSREERLRRIGALFYKAVVTSLARKQGIAGGLAATFLLRLGRTLSKKRMRW